MTFISGFNSGVRLIRRAGFIKFLAFSILALTVVVWMASEFSGRQPATVALDVGFSVVRFLAPIFIVLMVQELVSHEFDRRYFLLSLTAPISRNVFLLGRIGALLVMLFVFVGVLFVLLFGNLYLIALEYLSGEYFVGGLVSFIFMGIDLLVLSSLAFFLSVVSVSPSFVLVGTLGFMIAARSLSSVVELLARSSYVVSDAEAYRAALGGLGYLVPDLGSLDIRMVALYGRMDFLPADWPWLVLSNLAYAAAFLALAVWALNRKRFA